LVPIIVVLTTVAASFVVILFAVVANAGLVAIVGLVGIAIAGANFVVLLDVAQCSTWFANFSTAFVATVVVFNPRSFRITLLHLYTTNYLTNHL
jgi:hypothetical protein